MSQSFADAVNAAIYARRDKRRFFQKTTTGVTAQRRYLSFQMSGDPAAGSYPGAALAATQIVGGSSPTIAGGIVTIPDPASGLESVLLSCNCGGFATSHNGTQRWADLLACYQGANGASNLLQSMTGSAGGTSILPRYTSGEGVLIGIDVQTALGATPATATVTYTNQAGASSRTATASLLASAGTGTLFIATLQAGDTGVQSVQSVQLSASTGSGTFAVVLLRPLFDLPVLSQSSTAHNFGEKNFLDDEGAVVIETGAALVFIWEAANAVNNLLAGSMRSVDVSYP